MPVSRSDVEHVAALARLTFDEAALAQMEAQLNSILDHVDTLEGLDTAGVEPLAHPFAPAAPMRADATQPSDTAEALLNLAPRRTGRFIAVPPVIE